MIVEVIGLIGAGKSTRLSDLKERFKDSCQVHLEEEHTLRNFVLPLLQRLYSKVSGEDSEAEYCVEAFFTIIRALTTHGVMLTHGWHHISESDLHNVKAAAKANNREHVGGVLVENPHRGPLLFVLAILLADLIWPINWSPMILTGSLDL